jgi:hypothetical protein
MSTINPNILRLCWRITPEIAKRLKEKGPMATHNDRLRTAEIFNLSHSGRMQSATVERIYQRAFGDDYPADVQPNAFYSRTTLQRLANALEVKPGQVVADPVCGSPSRPGPT